MAADTTHGTVAEIKFLDGLGSYRPNNPNGDRKALLAGYLVAAERRANWGSIAADVVKAAARRQMEVA